MSPEGTLDKDGGSRPTGDPGIDRYKSALQMAYGAPFFTGNAIEVLRNGQQIFPAMLDGIRSAERSIKFLTFVYWTGQVAQDFAEALSQRARAGVEVKVLLDAFGARPMSRRLIDEMKEAGVAVRWYRPLLNWRVWTFDNRTHRKVLVIDDEVGFTGGVGIAGEWEGDARDETEWRDTHFRITGPAVDGLISSFLDNWSETGRSVTGNLSRPEPLSPAGNADLLVVRSTATIGWSDIANLFQTLVGLAQKRLRVATPYFVPDRRTFKLLVETAQRGVEVEILIPGRHVDKRVSELAASHRFRPLLAAGVTIWQFQTTMLHCKVITLDDRLACIGSANFNRRSMRKDDEVALIVDHPETVATLNDHYDLDRDQSHRLELDEWKRRGILRRGLERAASVLKAEA